jgi:hypothetical protein
LGDFIFPKFIRSFASNKGAHSGHTQKQHRPAAAKAAAVSCCGTLSFIKIKFDKLKKKPMKKIFISLLFLLVVLNLANSQNYYCAAYPDQNGQVELTLLNYCGSEIQWQVRDTSSAEWLDIVNGTTNPFLYDALPQNIEGKEFQAKMTLFPDTLPKYSYPFGIRLISDLVDVEVDDLYNGNFIYYSSNDTLLGTYFIDKKATWGCFDLETPIAEGTAVGTGKQNSDNILANCTEDNTAAKICSEIEQNGFADWYLPSIDELELILTTLRNGKIYQIQPQLYGANFGVLNNSKKYWSSTSGSSINAPSAFYGRIGSAEIHLTERYRSESYNVPISREVLPVDNNSFKCSAILIPYQFLNHISIVPVANNPSFVSIEYIGIDQNENQYNWNIDDGEVVSGSGAGPYIVEYPNALYKIVTMKFNNTTCNSPTFRSGIFQVNFFEENQSSFPAIYDGCVRWGDFNNDDLLDVILTGSDTTVIYINNSQGGFSPLNQNFLGLSNSYVSVGDFDNDNLLDFVICGLTIDSLPRTILYRNIDGQYFSEFNTSLPDVTSGFVEWLDFNNDGKLDILLSGINIINEPFTQLLMGDKTGSFIPYQTTLPNIENGFSAIDDYNKDGYQDLIILGNNGSERMTKVYKNNQGIFEEISTLLPGTFFGEAVWADFDHDGMLDFVFSGNKDSVIVEINGNTLSVTPSTSFFHYRNVGLDTFILEDTDSNDFGYPHKFGLSSLDCGDYNNDGFDDILITGMPNVSWVSVGIGGLSPFYRKSMPSILENNTDGSFITNNVNIPSFWTGSNAGRKPSPHPPKRFECSSIRFGDFNNDGNLDILREGKQEEFTSAIYENKTNTSNEAPQIPTNLESHVTCDSILLSWNSSSDDYTPETSITYEIYIGTTPNSGDVFSKKNIRKLRNTYFKLDSLPDGIYYWGVKAVDNARANSEYALEQSFEIDCITAIDVIVSSYNVSIYPNPFSADFTISVDGTDQQIFYSIVNQNGQTILDGFFRKSIKISDKLWHSGLYYLNLKVDNKLIAKKIIHAK